MVLGDYVVVTAVLCGDDDDGDDAPCLIDGSLKRGDLQPRKEELLISMADLDLLRTVEKLIIYGWAFKSGWSLFSHCLKLWDSCI